MRAGEVSIIFPLYTQPQCNKYLLTNERTTQHQLAASSHAFPVSLFSKERLY